jgi:hypothetical protein
MKQNYWTVECHYCHQTILLAPYDKNKHYKLSDSFALRHDEQGTRSDCHARGHYSFAELRRCDLSVASGLVPNLDFAEQAIPR